MKNELPSFAVLIDADNISVDTLSPILEEITLHGRLTVRRVYGDFTSPNLAAWRPKLAEHAIQPVQQYRNTTGKNASDIALVIDAMDLLHSRRFDGFCVVSSDSDFTRLAMRIREEGLVVYGFGEKKAPKAFVNACDRYIYIENLLAPAPPESEVTSASVEAPDVPPAPPAGQPAEAVLAAPTAITPPSAAAPPPAVPRPPTFKAPALAMLLLQKAYSNVADEQGWAMLGQLSSYIHANHSDFDPRSYGCAKFIELIQKTEAFEVALRPHKNGQIYFCRPKKARSTADIRANYQKALIAAVVQGANESGWAPLNAIRQKLHTQGRQIEESGYSTVAEALEGSGLFECQGGTGAARCFRVKRGRWQYSWRDEAEASLRCAGGPL